MVLQRDDLRDVRLRGSRLFLETMHAEVSKHIVLPETVPSATMRVFASGNIAYKVGDVVIVDKEHIAPIYVRREDSVGDIYAAYSSDVLVRVDEENGILHACGSYCFGKEVQLENVSEYVEITDDGRRDIKFVRSYKDLICIVPASSVFYINYKGDRVIIYDKAAVIAEVEDD